jgi:hypothetical protein
VVAEVDDQTSLIGQREHPEVDALLEPDRPGQHGLEVAEPHELAHDRSAGIGAGDPLRPL